MANDKRKQQNRDSQARIRAKNKDNEEFKARQKLYVENTFRRKFGLPILESGVTK